ncbi:transcriptional regulator [Caballeronia choica]|jgi:two-component system, OmpR family, response regulator QseB|uniref:Transcriptional regulator n=1 Tax=Caballeronia choica TaxID=326476 RepID=A0A158L0W7_9BURK|nr:transcriptional regulator [Caballeronia choica]
MRILLAEDDDLIGSGLEVALNNAGFAVDWAREGQHAKFSLATTDYDLIILDLGLPNITGMSLLTSPRAERITTPVLVLTARDAHADRVVGLDAGADDYVGKPFDIREVISRCRA